MAMLTGVRVNRTPSSAPNGAQTDTLGGYVGETLVSEYLGRYASLALGGRLFSAFATITSGVIYSTAAQTGGPLLWNGTSNLNAQLLAVLVGGVTTANTVPTSIGITGNGGQTAAPSSTSAIGASGNTLIGGAAPSMSVYSYGTVTNAGNRFLPLAAYSTGAITVDTTQAGWIDLGGAIIVPPNSWAAVSFANTATTGVIQLGLLWAELSV